MNLIFIMLDSFRQDHISLYNHGKEVFPGVPACKTPNIDKFARDCIIFDNAYPCGLPTIPVRFELMTGHYSLQSRPWCPLTPYDLTIAKILAQEGYISGFVTDVYHYRAPGYNYHSNFNMYRWVRGQEYDPFTPPISLRDVNNYVNEFYTDYWRTRVEQFLANTDEMKEDNWFTAQVVEHSISFLKKLRSNNVEKIFLWLDFFEPHEPWDPPKRFDTYTDPNYHGPRLIMPMGGRALNWATEEQINFIRGLYAGEASFVDYCLGQLFESLEKLGFYEDSLIILTADHGHPLADHGKFLKGPDRMYNELLRVPFFIRMPGGKYGGRRVKALVQFPDVLPTILDILGYKNDTISLAGKSFAQVVTGEVEKHHSAVIIGYHANPERCIRNEKWSYVQTAGVDLSTHRIVDVANINIGRKTYSEESHMLFDIENDPRETKNLIDKYPEVAVELANSFGNIFRKEIPKFIRGIQGDYEMGASSIK